MLTEKCKNQESMLTTLFCCVFQVIRMLTEKCKNQESMLAEYELRDQEYQEVEAEADLLRQQVEATR